MKDPDPPPATPPPPPAGLHPAGRCPFASGTAAAHAPHLWAWRTDSRKSWDVIRPSADTPAGTRWCDGGGS